MMLTSTPGKKNDRLNSGYSLLVSLVVLIVLGGLFSWGLEYLYGRKSLIEKKNTLFEKYLEDSRSAFN